MGIINVISDLIGYAVIAGSALFQLPQIYTILSRKSAAGISLVAYFIETSMFSVALAWGIAYKLNLSNYGENIPVFIQLITVILLIGYYSHQMKLAMAGAISLTLFTYLLAARILPDRVLEVLYATQVLSVILAKLPQVYLTFKRKATGTLNLFTVLLMFGGASARVVTTIVGVSWEQGKIIMTTGFAAGTILNGLMVLQFFIYPRDLPAAGNQEPDDVHTNVDSTNNSITTIHRSPSKHQAEELRIISTNDDEELPSAIAISSIAIGQPIQPMGSHVTSRCGSRSQSFVNSPHVAITKIGGHFANEKKAQ